MEANFAPTLNTYTGQGAFKFWCQTVLPIVYDDSLSYYELLNKVVKYLNNTISDVANMEENVDALLTAYQMLENYVNEYFNSLDISSEINQKLDEMALDGSLTELISPFVPALVSAWLGEHITPTTPALDDTMLVENAAAESSAVGGFIFPHLVDFLTTTSFDDLTDLPDNKIYRTTNAPDRPSDVTASTGFWVNTLVTGRHKLQIGVATNSKMVYLRHALDNVYSEWINNTSVLREEFMDFENNVTNIARYPTVQQGNIDANGENTFSTARIRTVMFESNHSTCNIVINTGYRARFFYYNSSGVYQNASSYYEAGTYTINFGGTSESERWNVRIVIGKTGDSAIYNYEFSNAIVCNEFKVIPYNNELAKIDDLPYVTPEMFGGYGYNSEDEMDYRTVGGVTSRTPYSATQAIQAAINTGKPVYFSAKNYYLGGQIVIKNPTALFGAGQNCTKLIWNSDNVGHMISIRVNSADGQPHEQYRVLIRDIGFDGKFYAYSAIFDGLGNKGYFDGNTETHLYYPTRAVIDNVYIEHCRYGVIMNATGSTLTNSVIYGGADTDTAYFNYLNQGLAIYNSDNFVSNVRVLGHYKIGINLQSGSNMLENVKSCVNFKGISITGDRQSLRGLYLQENYEDNIRILSTKSSVISFVSEGAGCVQDNPDNRATYIATNGLSDYGCLYMNSVKHSKIEGTIRTLTSYSGSTGDYTNRSRYSVEGWGAYITDNSNDNVVDIVYALGSDETYTEVPTPIVASDTALNANYVTETGIRVTPT